MFVILCECVCILGVNVLLLCSVVVAVKGLGFHVMLCYYLFFFLSAILVCLLVYFLCFFFFSFRLLAFVTKTRSS